MVFYFHSIFIFISENNSTIKCNISHSFIHAPCLRMKLSYRVNTPLWMACWRPHRACWTQVNFPGFKSSVEGCTYPGSPVLARVASAGRTYPLAHPFQFTRNVIRWWWISIHGHLTHLLVQGAFSGLKAHYTPARWRSPGFDNLPSGKKVLKGRSIFIFI